MLAYAEQSLLFLTAVWFIRSGNVSATMCNVALCRPTKQSSLSPFVNLTLSQPCNAVDGITDADIYHGSCMEVDSGDFPEYSWWQVDLGDSYTISHVNITLRTYVDDILLKISNFIIYVAETLQADGRVPPLQVCVSYLVKAFPSLSDAGKTVKINCAASTYGRYLEIIRMLKNDNYMSFCEMEVYANVLTPDCPNPPEDWQCRYLVHSSTMPRLQCGYTPGHQTTIEPTSEIQTTIDYTTESTNKATTDSVSTSATTTETFTTDVSTFKTTLTEWIQTSNDVISSTLGTTSGEVTTNKDSMTTSLDTVTTLSTNTSQTCYCPCRDGGYLVLTDIELIAKIDKIITEIKIDPKTTSMARRKLISVKDNRPSAKAVGAFGAIILISVAVFIMILDADIVVKSIGSFMAKRKRTDV